MKYILDSGALDYPVTAWVDRVINRIRKYMVHDLEDSHMVIVLNSCLIAGQPIPDHPVPGSNYEVLSTMYSIVQFTSTEAFLNGEDCW